MFECLVRLNLLKKDGVYKNYMEHDINAGWTKPGQASNYLYDYRTMIRLEST